MTDEELYHILFNAITDAVEAMKKLGQHRTILVRRLRSQNFRQIVRKFEGILCVFPRIFGRYDGILCKQDACRELCGVALDFGKAREILIAAQQKTEEAYIARKE